MGPWRAHSHPKGADAPHLECVTAWQTVSPIFQSSPPFFAQKKKKGKIWLYEINNFCQLYILIFWPCRAAYGILVPQPGAEPAFPALEEAWSLNYWTSRKVLCEFLNSFATVTWHIL